MKKLLPLTLAFFLSQLLAAQTPNSWTRRNDMGREATNPLSARVEAVAFSIGTKGYVATGSNTTTKLNDLWEYDMGTNSWTQKAALPGPARDKAVGFSIGNKGYVGTGQDFSGGRLNDFWEYDPASNTWTQKASFAGTPRRGAVGLAIGGKGYIGTGNDATGNKSDLWEYDPATNAWLQKATMPGTGRDEAAGFTIGSKGYIGSGFSPKTFYEYNPATNTWTAKANVPGSYPTENVGFSVGQKGYFATGNSSSSGVTADTYEYNPATNTWTTKSNTSGGRKGATAFTIGNKAFLTTGWDLGTGYRNDLWEFDPAATSIRDWVQRASLGGKGRKGGVGFSILNKGYVGAGYDGFRRKDFWEYDPLTDTWSQKANLPGKPRNDAFGFGIGNKGYLGGGLDTLHYGIPDFWEYDPATNRWTEKASVYGGNPVAFVGFSIGKKGYVYGGFAQNFLEYDPETDTWTPKALFPGVFREGATAFSIGNKGYLGLGNDNVAFRRDFYEYDQASNTWAIKANFPGSVRYHGVGFGLGSKGYIGNGVDYNNNFYSDFYEYDVATNTWTGKAAVPGDGRQLPVAFSIGARGFWGLGYNNRKLYLHDFWEYNPQTAPVIKDVAIATLNGIPESGCGLSAQQTLSVTIVNLGSQPESNIPVGLLLNGTPITPAPEIFTGTLAPNASATHTFSVPANLSASGNYVLKPYALLTGDQKTANDTATYRITNWMRPGLPSYDFEVKAQNMPYLRVAPYRYNTIVHLPVYPSPGNSSQGILAMMQNNFPDAVNMVIPGDIWQTYQDRVGGAYLCFNPSGGSSSDSLWLTFDLKQRFHQIPQNTNFRITVNGQQIGATYNPASAATVGWNQYKVNLFQFRNATSLEIGFESLLNIEVYNYTDPMNELDNIRVRRRIGTATGLEPDSPELQFQLFPNPTTGSFTLVASGKGQQLQVLDLTGKLIKQQQLTTGKNQIELKDAAKGLYLVKLITPSGTGIKKLILQ